MDGEYAHLLGTDARGRDILSQLLYSTRAAFFQCLRGLTRAIPDDKLVPALQQSLRHAASHLSESDESDLHFV